MILKKITDKALKDFDVKKLNGGTKGVRIPVADGLYFFVTKEGKKRWECRYKKLNGKYTFKKIGTLAELSHAEALTFVEKVKSYLKERVDLNRH